MILYWWITFPVSVLVECIQFFALNVSLITLNSVKQKWKKAQWLNVSLWSFITLIYQWKTKKANCHCKMFQRGMDSHRASQHSIITFNYQSSRVLQDQVDQAHKPRMPNIKQRININFRMPLVFRLNIN